MIINCKISNDCKKAIQLFTDKYGTDNCYKIEKIGKPKSNQQLRYLHAIISIWGIELGLIPSEAKIEVKRMLGYHYEKKGKFYLKSFADFDNIQQTVFVDRFRALANADGIYLPTPDEYNQNWQDIEKYINNGLKF